VRATLPEKFMIAIRKLHSYEVFQKRP